MPRAVIVDDEPQARRYLAALVARHCPDFSIAGEAEGGEEALDLVGRCGPDVVLSDVRMPGMDGLELARRLREEAPSVAVVIVSGYEDFEYARSAMKAGVVDYLLKPVKAEQLKAVLGEVASRAGSELRRRRARALGDIVSGAGSGDPACLPSGRYSAAVLRLGPPPSRFPASDAVAFASFGAAEGASSGADPDSRLAAIGGWALPGRDRRELVFVRAGELTGCGDFERAVSAIAEGSGVAYRVLAVGTESFALGELEARVAALRRAADAGAAPGRSLALRCGFGERPAGPEGAPRPLELSALEGRVEFLLSQARYAELERALREIVAAWEREARPLVQMAARLRRLFSLARRRSGGEAAMREDEPDSLVEEATTAASDYAELADLVAEALSAVVRPPSRSGGKEDLPAFFASIRRYIEENYAEDVSLQSTCRLFSISQTYLSRLFRRHEGLSFNDYLTRVRIEAAKRLMSENPAMPLKEVAALSGYQDQFYFSRVFKAEVGQPPSEYASSLKPGPD